MNAGDRLRLYVCDSENEEVFGYTDWVPYYTSASMPKSKFWLYSGWSDCIQECGPEQQTRDAFYVDTDVWKQQVIDQAFDLRIGGIENLGKTPCMRVPCLDRAEIICDRFVARNDGE